MKIGVGEFIDRQSILLIKQNHGLSVDSELNELKSHNSKLSKIAFEHYLNLMISINSVLWELEDMKRSGISRAHSDYINVAELITQLNDVRYFVKKKIDEFFNSEYSEQKSHKF